MPLADLDFQTLRAVAETLAVRPVADIVPARGGGNNRIFRITCADGDCLALKVYPAQATDPRDRLGAEYAALSFVAKRLGDCVPAPIGRDDQHHCAVYGWVEGAAVAVPRDADIDAVAAFWLGLQDWRAEAGGLGPASAACLSGEAVWSQLQDRLNRLAQAACDQPELADFLAEKLAPTAAAAAARARDGYAAMGLDFAARLPDQALVLSPSDFGFHNILRRDDGRLVFLDFEYFGWDDPVKAVADILLHPGVPLISGRGERFLDAVRPALDAASEGDFGRRLSLLYPLHGLIWCLILLNEFLPERWARRRMAREMAQAIEERQVVCDRQMRKSRQLHQRINDNYERGIFFS